MFGIIGWQEDQKYRNLKYCRQKLFRTSKQREQINNKYSFEWMKLNAPWWRHKRLFTPIYKTLLSTLFALADWKYIHFVNYYFVNLFSVPALLAFTKQTCLQERVHNEMEIKNSSVRQTTGSYLIFMCIISFLFLLIIVKR